MTTPISEFDLDRLVRPNVRRLRPYRSARESVTEGVLLDANENPYEKTFDGAALNRYPDPRQRSLRAALAERLQLRPGQILAGTGSDEALDWIFKVFCRPGVDAVAAASPSYGMYRVQADVHDVTTIPLPLDENFDFSARTLLKTVTPRVKVVFLCSPNNPTGNLLDRGQIFEACRNWGGIVVVDEAYVEFSGAQSLVGQLDELPNLVVMRTFSKALARAGIRLGYAVADPRIIAYFMKVKAPYNLSAVTMRMGVETLADTVLIDRQIAEIRGQRDWLSRKLKELPEVSEVFPSRANFVLFRCPGAARLCRALLERGIVVRDRGGLPRLQDTIRVTVGAPRENQLFLQEFRELLKEDS